MEAKTRTPKGLLGLPLQKRAELALHKAVRGVIREHARLGLPIYIGRNGKVVKLSPSKVRGLSRSTHRK
jgi:hypothetical protein